MQKILVSLLVMISPTTLIAGTHVNDHGDYSTSCTVRGGFAEASVESHRFSMSVDGKLTLKMYDWGGSLIHKSKKRFISHLGRHDEVVVFDVTAPWDAHTCELVAKSGTIDLHGRGHNEVQVRHVYQRRPQPRNNTVVIHQYEPQRRRSGSHVVIESRRHPRPKHTRVKSTHRVKRQKQRHKQKTRVEVNLPRIKATF